MKVIRISIVLVGILGLLFSGCSKEEGGEQAETQQTGAVPAPPADLGDPTVVVVVDGTEITNRQIEEESARLMQQMGGSASPQQMESMKGVVKQQATDNIINRTLLDRAIEGEGIEVTQAEVDQRMEEVRANFGSEEEMRSRLAMMGMTEELMIEEMSKVLKIEKLMEKYTEVSEATDADVREYYDSNPGQFQQPERMRVSHVLFGLDDGATPEMKAEKKAEAERVLEELGQGGNFEELAAQHSTCPSSSRGGDLGYFERGRMVKPFEDAAFTLEIGETSGIVETRFGFHIIKAVDREDGRTVPFEEAKVNITGFLDGRGKQQALTTYTDELRSNAVIEYKDTP